MTTTPLSTTLEQHRQQFPALIHNAYFNYGGQGTMPIGALDAIQQANIFMQETGPFSTTVNQWIMRQSDELRASLAAAVGVPVETMTLTEDVSVGCNIALWGLDWRSGDHLLLSDCEHPGIVAAAHEIGRRFGVEVSYCGLMETLNQGDPVAVIEAALRSNTRMVALSHILWNTGQVLPLREILQLCHDRSKPIRVMVDAAQSVGMLPLDLDAWQVDFYAFTGHKWMCGPAGVGGLYVSAEARAELHPTFIGWRSVTKNAAGHPTGWQPDGTRYEIATSAFVLYPALQATIATHQQWGSSESRYERLRQLSQILWQRLNELGWITCLKATPPESGLVSFQINGFSGNQHDRLVRFLEQRGFLLRTILDPDCVRACVHYLTTETEIDRLITAIQQFQSNG